MKPNIHNRINAAETVGSHKTSDSREVRGPRYFGHGEKIRAEPPPPPPQTTPELTARALKLLVSGPKSLSEVVALLPAPRGTNEGRWRLDLNFTLCEAARRGWANGHCALAAHAMTVYVLTDDGFQLIQEAERRARDARESTESASIEPATDNP